MRDKSPYVELIPIFDDNYVFVIVNAADTEALLVDPGEASAALNFLEKHHLKLSGILITHHHADHIDGLPALRERLNAPVFAPLKNKQQIPADHYVDENDKISLSGFEIKIISLPGHTLGIQAYWFEAENWLFSGDVLFGLGCGRLFEGSFEQGYTSLQKIKKLPPATRIYCTHEYTHTNLKFCKSLAARDAALTDYEQQLKVPSVPLTLALEIKTNPFLRAQSVAEFTTLRELRNTFKA